MEEGFGIRAKILVMRVQVPAVGVVFEMSPPEGSDGDSLRREFVDVTHDVNPEVPVDRHRPGLTNPNVAERRLLSWLRLKAKKRGPAAARNLCGVHIQGRNVALGLEDVFWSNAGTAYKSAGDKDFAR